MSVPSYDDLTPGIPGVIDAEAAGNLASLLQDSARARLPASSSQQPAAGFQLPAAGCQLPAAGYQLPASGLFACVRLEAVSGKPEAGSWERDALLAIARDFSPRVRQASAGEVLLDVSGLGRLIGPPAEIERQIAHALVDARVAARIAIGPTQTIARLLARSETDYGHTLRHEDHKDRKDHKEQKNSLCDLCGLRGLCAGACGRGPWLQLPVELLRELEVLPPAINHRDRARPYDILERWGIATLGELAALPAADLSSRLGRRGVALQRLARGLDAVPFVPDGDTPRYVARLELEWPIEALEPLSFVFARLLEPLSVSLERADRGAAAVHLDLRLTDRSTHTRLLQLPAPMRDARVLRTLLLLDLESHPPSPLRGFGGTTAVTAAVDVVTIELDPAPARITQFSLLQRALPSPEHLSTLTARLSALIGEARVGTPVLEDSHRPGAFAMTRYAPEGAGGAGVPVVLRCGAGGATGAGDNGAMGADPVLRRERRSVALHVSVEHGRPVHIAASRRDVPYGAIVEAAGPWRTSGQWWSTSWNRDEWDVALKTGAVCRIHQDRATRRWFFEGLYD